MPPPLIWNPDAVLPPSTRLRPLNSNGNNRKRAEGKANPEQEAARMAALKRLRHRLVTLCSKQQGNNKAKPPTLAMERWISRAALQRDLEASESEKDNNSILKDPVLPSSGLADPGLTKDLSRTIGLEQAKNVAELMAVDAKAAADRISKLDEKNKASSTSTTDQKWKNARKQLKDCTKLVKKTSKSVQTSLDKLSCEGSTTENENSDADEEETDTNNTSLQTSLTALKQATNDLDTCRQKMQRMTDLQSGDSIILDASRRSGICDVMLLQADGSPKKPYLTISTSHLIKAAQLWQFHNKSSSHQPITPKAILKNVTAAIQGLPDAKDFLKHLYCCLARYETIKGAGYQCAVPPVAFDAAHQELGLGMTIECFASPFNCRYRDYCSAFPDLERPFGSLGSFFDDHSFFPSHGSFEANPPFVPETMYAMNAKLERLLANPEATALSFLVIVPVWGTAGTDYVKELEASTFCIAKARILAADHSFCDGAQHKSLKQELRPSSWDTAVMLLQNPEGAKEWPVSQEKLDRVFGSALRSSGTNVSLADWEHRGVGRGGNQSSNRASNYNNNNNNNNNQKRPFQSSGKHDGGKRTKF
jgi:hypothetical protein